MKTLSKNKFSNWKNSLTNCVKKNKLYIYLFQFSIISLIFYFLFHNAFQNYSQLTNHHFKFDIVNFCVSLPFLFMSFPLNVYGWKTILRTMGENIAFKKCFKFASLSLLYKYIPGYIWPYLGKIYYCKGEGIPETKTSVSIYIEQWMTITSGIILFFITLLFGQSIFYKENIIAQYFPLLVLITVFLHPKVIIWFLNFILKIAQKDEIKIDLRILSIIELMLIYLGFWMLCGVGFCFLTNSIYSIGFDKLHLFAGIFAISWVIGFLSFFVPMGLGVREAILSALLSFFMPGEIAIIIALAARLWLTLPEIVYGGLPMLKQIHSRSKSN